MKKIIVFLFIISAAVFSMNACKHQPVDEITIPPPVSGPTTGVCFESEILPLLQSNCAKSGCHDAISRQDGYVLDSYANIYKKGIVPGNATNSKIYKVLFETGNDKMPPAGNPDLTDAQKALIGRWINEGAKNTINCNVSCDSNQFKYAANVSVIMSTYCTGCHGGANPSANINLSFYNGVRQMAISGRLVGAVSHAPGYSAMPKSGGKLSECQIAQIRKWVNSGAPNN
jgi:hypothetical protein